MALDTSSRTDTADATLIVGPSWVGDMVMAQSLFMAIKRDTPQQSIDVLAPAWSRPLLERMPEVRAAIDLPFGHGEFAPAQRWRLGRALRGRYRQAIVLPNSWKSALPLLAAGIPMRTGWLGEQRWGLLNDARRLDKQRLRRTVERFVALSRPVGETEVPEIIPPRLNIDPDNAAAACATLGLHPARAPVLALCPGAEFGPAKRWPTEKYAELAGEYIGRGWQVWLFGSGKDEPVTATIASQSNQACVDLAGRTSLAQAVDLLSLADAVVSNDSGLMHVAAALARPLVAVYGSSDPGFTPPLNVNSRVLWLELECSPCFKRECPLGHLRCLEELSVSAVRGALEELLRDGPAGEN